MKKAIDYRKQPIISVIALLIFFLPNIVQADAIYERITPKWGKFDLKMHNTSAEKWKATWYCFSKKDGRADMSKRKKIDADTYPSSVGRTRTTKITKSNCPSGLWAISFELNVLGNWRAVDPDKGLCGSDNWSCGAWTDIHSSRLGNVTFSKYLPNSWFKWKSGTRACIEAWNFSYMSVYVNQFSTASSVPNDKKFKTSRRNCTLRLR